MIEPDSHAPRARRLWPKLAVLVAFALAADQFVQHVLLSEGAFLGRPVAPFDPPLFHQPQRDELARARQLVAGQIADERGIGFDAELGWVGRAGRGSGQYSYDAVGARDDGEPTSVEPDPGRPRVVAVGCSFTHGDGVAGHEAWPAVVERLAAPLEVVNLGVGAYGLDQALLRLRRDGAPLAPDEVWLGLLPAACLRVTTLYRPFARHWSTALAFKPRFVLEDSGDLTLIENPARSLAEVVGLLEDQRLLLERVGRHDTWVARAPWAYAPRGSHPSHWSGLARLALTAHENLGREHAAHLGVPQAPTHRLLRAIVLEAHAEARRLGAEFRFLILPGPTDLAWVEEHGAGYWQPFVDELTAAGIDCFDASAALRSAREAGREIFLADGHYTPEGNRVVAEAFAIEAGRDARERR